jgi:pre-rRNA-processing protein TSR1
LEEETREDCIPVGSYARLHIKEVPSVAASKLCTLAKTTPVTACGLLKHESKLSVLHFRCVYAISFYHIFCWCILVPSSKVTLSEHTKDVLRTKSLVFFSVKKHETYDAPIKSKEELIFHVGFRQFVGRPTFSSEFINTDKNKMERFLHAGRFSVASIYAPISFPPVPTIVLKRVGEDATPAVAAVGSLKTVDPDRIILKRVILTGYVYLLLPRSITSKLI